MSTAVAGDALRVRRLRALGVAPLRLRSAAVADADPHEAQDTAAPTRPQAGPPAVAETPPGARIRRLALLADPVERRDPAIDKMYTALTEAVSKAGLQPVRVCDVAADATAAVMVFGAAALPEGIPLVRVLRADPLVVLHAERDRKRQLWEQLQALGRGGAS
ncbi:MAG TPA: hypothetical protein VFJ87_05270 [Rhodanobacteraceae bacterium]|nr:hypothetical protein [Rhodanobacteraceae bacterium]